MGIGDEVGKCENGGMEPLMLTLTSRTGERSNQWDDFVLELKIFQHFLDDFIEHTSRNTIRKRLNGLMLSNVMIS